MSSDNALGARRGDVDDAFALAALFAAGAPIAAVASVFGNTTEPRARKNIRALAPLCGFGGTVLHGAARAGDGPSEAARALASAPAPVRVLALGPLTDLAAALASRPEAASSWAEIVAVGGHASPRARGLVMRPREFNLAKDPPAATAVLASSARLTLVPLDVAQRLTISRDDLDALPGPVGAYLRSGSRRWLLRARLVHLARSFPVWDLAAALYALDPSGFEIERRSVRIDARGRLAPAAGGRHVRLVLGFDRDRLWTRFVSLLEAFASEREAARPVPR